MPDRRPTWTARDDQGEVMVIRVAAGDLHIAIGDGRARFRTGDPMVTQDVRMKLGAAMGQQLADRGESWEVGP